MTNTERYFNSICSFRKDLQELNDRYRPEFERLERFKDSASYMDSKRLLDSDILTADDLLALADQYSDKPTMLRLIMPRARQAMCTANTTRDHNERDALDRVIDKCLGYLNADLIAFDRLDAELAGEQAD